MTYIVWTDQKISIFPFTEARRPWCAVKFRRSFVSNHKIITNMSNWCSRLVECLWDMMSMSDFGQTQKSTSLHSNKPFDFGKQNHAGLEPESYSNMWQSTRRLFELFIFSSFFIQTDLGNRKPPRTWNIGLSQKRI